MPCNRLPRVMKHYSPTGRRYYGSETWTIKARDTRRITAAEMKYMRRTAGYTWTDYKTNYKVIKNNTNFGQITGIQEKLDTTCK